MKALLAFAIGLVMLVSAMIVMGVAVAEEDVIDEVLIEPSPGEDPQEPGEYYNEWVDGDGNIWRTDYYVNEDGTIYATGLMYRVDENGNYISNDPPMDEIYQPLDLFSEMQTPKPLSDQFWAFDDISLPGIPDMFIDMDDIFNQIDIPTWQPKKLPETEPPELIIWQWPPDERPYGWVGPWEPYIIINPDDALNPCGPKMTVG